MDNKQIEQEIKALGLRDYEHYLQYKEFCRLVKEIEKQAE